MTGRGLLGRFGPNHAADPIVTRYAVYVDMYFDANRWYVRFIVLTSCDFRWKMTSSGALIENGKKVLEFVAIQRKDNQEWAIPGVSRSIRRMH